VLLGALICTVMIPCATPALAAGAMPGAATAPMQRVAHAQRRLPGRRSFAVLLGAAGVWWIAQGLGFVV
jgi:hypothetical protein